MWWIFGGKFSVGFPLKNRLEFVTKSFTTFTARKEMCHLELTLGASSPNKFNRPRWIAQLALCQDNEPDATILPARITELLLQEALDVPFSAKLLPDGCILLWYRDVSFVVSR